MGILDKIKDMMGGASKKAESALGGVSEKAGGAMGGAAGKAGDLRQTVGGAVEGVVDKAADAVDGATKGKYTDQIDKVRDLADKIDGEEGSAAGKSETGA